MTIDLVQGSILDASVEVIVNPANPQLLRGGGLSGVIHEAAGEELYKYLKKWKRENRIPALPHGQCMISPSFNLPFKYIIHAIGAVWKDGNSNEKETLSNCYKACLELADQHELKSIAFPNISTGIYGFPKDIAAEIAIEVVLEYESNSLQRAIFYCFDRESYYLYDKKI